MGIGRRAVQRLERFGQRVRSAVERRTPADFAVLGYHRIGPVACDPWDLAVSPAQFEHQVTAMCARGRIVSLADEVRRPRRTRIGHGDLRFALTFDDGYADNLHAALEVLERHSAPATVFIATGFLDRPAFWWDRIAELTLGDGVEQGEVAAACRDLGILDDADPADAPRTSGQLHAAVYGRLIGLDRWRIDDALDELSSRLGTGPVGASCRPLTTDELGELAAHPLITIGSHTVSHPRLTRLEGRAALREVEEGRDVISQLLGREPRLFAYPHGDATSATARLVASAGFECAVTTDARWVSPLDDLRLLPRLHPTDVEGDVFARWLDQR